MKIKKKGGEDEHPDFIIYIYIHTTSSIETYKSTSIYIYASLHKHGAGYKHSAVDTCRIHVQDIQNYIR